MSQPDSQHSVSEWLTTVHASQGEAETAWRQLWNRYAPQVTALARARLTDRRQPLADEDDVVVAELSLVACETLAGLLDSLQDDTLRQVALLRIFSSPDEEIAGAIGLSVRTVQRKVQVIAQRRRDAARSQNFSIEDLRQAFRSGRFP